MGVVKFNKAGGLKIDPALYAAFINGNSATFGPVPPEVSTLGAVNRAILENIVAAGHAVTFGAGIYPLDDAAVLSKVLDMRGAGRGQTLLWAPQSHALHYTAGGAIYPRITEMTIEAQGNVLRTDAWAVNAIHGLLADDAAFVSYADHALENDVSVSGGTGCPIYGTRMSNVGICAGPGKSGVFEWQSGSNVFDNFVDQHLYFDGSATRFKGVMRALFQNSTVHMLCNSVLSYAGMDYVYLYEKAGAPKLGLHGNVFEGSPAAFQAIAKVDTSNFYLNASQNRYLQDTAKENGHHFILKAGNSYIEAEDSPSPIYDENMNIRNRSGKPVRSVSGLVDAGGAKRRLIVCGPEALGRDGVEAPHADLVPVTEAVAAEAHMSDMWAKYGSELSYLRVTEWTV